MSIVFLPALELVLLGLLAGVVGTVIVLRDRAFFAVALSHATFPGGVIFALAGWQVLIGQALFAALLVLLLWYLRDSGGQAGSGIVLAFGFALGAFIAGANPGLGVPVEALLVGSPLGVSPLDVWVTALALCGSAALLWLFRRRILFHTFDPAGFSAAGFRLWPTEILVSALVAMAVVVAMPAVGAVLGAALLIAPAAAAELVATRVGWIPPIAAALGVFSGLCGLWWSSAAGIAAGGAIGLVAAACYVFAALYRALLSAYRRSRAAAAAV